jgi:HlyD family secretion protein
MLVMTCMTNRHDHRENASVDPVRPGPGTSRALSDAMTGQDTIDVFTGAARRRPWRKRVIVLALLAGAGIAAWQIAVRWEREDTAPAYTLAEVTRGDIRSQVTASGTLNPLVQVQVGSQVSGRVKELHADFNDPVKKGQLIALIDPELFESDVTQARARQTAARAALARAEAQAADARAQHQRFAALDRSGTVARAEVETAATNVRVADAAVISARAEVTLARAAVEQAEANLTYTKITSPIDGVVVSRNVDVGQTVAASLSAPTLFVIAGDLRQMEVHTNVAESDVGQITPGQKVEFTVDAYPARTFAGAVRQVRYAAQTVSNVVTYDAVVAVENPDLELRPGMTANVSFIVAERRDVLTVPTAALRYRPASASANPDGPRERPAGEAAHANGSRGPAGEAAHGDGPRRRTVWALRNGQPVAVRVRTGLSDGSITEIVEGELSPGESIIVGDGSTPAAADPAGQARPGGNRQGGGRRGPPRIL